MKAFPDMPDEWRSHGEQVIDRLIDTGVTFPEGRPTCWHHKCGGDTPRTYIAYEEVRGYGANHFCPATCLYKEHLYSEIWTHTLVKQLAKKDFYIGPHYEHPQFILLVGLTEGE